MPVQMNNCSRCGVSILGNGTTSQVKEVRDFLEDTHHTALCDNCTDHYEKLTALADGQKFPTSSGEYVRGLQYYIENNFWVFTEFYHFLRGNCCGSGCRHCAYGFKKNKIYEESV